MTPHVTPAMTFAMTCLAAGTLLLLFAAYWPAPAAPKVPAAATPTLVPAPTTVPLAEVTAGPPRPHWTPTPKERP